jgi:hypothetical protein
MDAIEFILAFWVSRPIEDHLRLMSLISPDIAFFGSRGSTPGQWKVELRFYYVNLFANTNASLGTLQQVLATWETVYSVVCQVFRLISSFSSQELDACLIL